MKIRIISETGAGFETYYCALLNNKSKYKRVQYFTFNFGHYKNPIRAAVGGVYTIIILYKENKFPGRIAFSYLRREFAFGRC